MYYTCFMFGLYYCGTPILITDDDDWLASPSTAIFDVSRPSDSVRTITRVQWPSKGGEQRGMGECYFSGPRSLDKVG